MKTTGNTITIILFFAFLTISDFSLSQDNNLFYHMKNLPQSYSLNPAMISDSAKVVLAIPGLSSTNIGMHSTFSIGNIAQRDGTSMVVDLNRLYDILPKTNYISQNLSIPLLDFQLRSKDQVFSFSITENEQFKFQFDKELIGLASKGNAAYIGQTFETNFDARFMHYRSFAFGYTQKAIENLTVGGRVKLITGFSTFDVVSSKLSIKTDTEIEYIDIAAEGEYNLSLPVTFERNDEGDIEPTGLDNFNVAGYIANFSNLGFSVDIGAKYNISPQIEVSASVIDLGGIGWKSGITNLSHNGKFKWEGLNFSNSIDDTDQEYVPFSEKIENITDSIFSLLDFDINNNNFSTGIPTKVYIGGKYKLNDTYSVGLVDRILFFDGSVSNAITLSGNAQYGKVLSLSASYAVIGNAYANIGIATALKLGPVGLFLATDNILAITNPLTTKHMNISFGFNFMFGNKYEIPEK